MTQTNVTFLSYNSTGMNTVKSSWMRDLIKVTDASYVQVQEHFKSSKVTDKFFTDQFPDFNNFVIPAHHEQNQDSGRAKGGLAQLSKSKLDVKKTRVKCSNFSSVTTVSFSYNPLDQCLLSYRPATNKL